MSEQKTKECFINNNMQYFSYFNHKLYDSPIFIQEEENFTKFDINNQSIEESSDNTSHQSVNSIDDEDKYIPLNLLELSPKKKSISFDEENESDIKQEKKEIISDKNDFSVKEIKPELQKYILPKSLFNVGKNKKPQEEKKAKEKSPSPCPQVPSSSSKSTSKLVNQLNLLSKPFVPKFKIVSVLLVNNPSFVANTNNNKNIPINNNRNKNKNLGFYEKKKKKKNKEFIEREGDWSCYRCKNINFAFRDKCNKCKMAKDESEMRFKEVGQALIKLADLSIYKKSKGSN
jgi:hypothetical protein